MNQFCFLLIGVLTSMQLHALVPYDSFLRISSFENEISFVGMEVDSTFFNYVYLGDEHFYTQINFYINKNVRAEVLLWSDYSCIYRQFFQGFEVSLGKLEIDSNNYDLLEYDICDLSGVQSSTNFKNFAFRRSGSWKDSEFIHDLLVHEKQYYVEGVKHGQFEKHFNTIRLQLRTFDSGVLVSDSTFYSNEISSSDFLGTWLQSKPYKSSDETLKTFKRSIYVLEKNNEQHTNSHTVTFQNDSLMSSINNHFNCFETSENGKSKNITWHWNNETRIISFPEIAKFWQIHFITKELIILSESD